MMFLLALSIWTFSPFHPLYLSTCQIQVNSDSTWSGTIKIFYDDLEDALHNGTGTRPTLHSENLLKHQRDIQLYLQEKFIINAANHRPLNFNVVELERKEDVVLIHFKGEMPWPGKVLRITNSILMEIFSAQKNVVMINFPEEAETLFFNKNRNSVELINP